MTTGKEYVAGVFEKVKALNAHEPEFLQAVEEVFESLVPVFDKYPKYVEENLLERLVEPERHSFLSVFLGLTTRVKFK